MINSSDKFIKSMCNASIINVFFPKNRMAFLNFKKNPLILLIDIDMDKKAKIEINEIITNRISGEGI